jgi:hypothetical protein
LGRNPIPSDDLSTQPAYGSGGSSSAANQSPSGDNQSPYAASQPAYTAGQPAMPAGQYRYGDLASRAVENINPPIRNQMTPDTNYAGSDSRPATSMPQQTQPGSPPLSIPSSPSVAGRTAPAHAAPPGGSSTGATPPAGERPRMVNSKTFDLDYEVEGVGPSGIAKVELWGTRDGGRTWTSYGVSKDNRSPIRANVEGEGLYGFRITVQSGNGLGGSRPHSGDAPDMWVMVDLTKPVVRLIDATAGDGPNSGALLIRWQASDAALAARPITILFSDRPGGQWSIIAAGLENTGQYAWRPDSRAPDQIYLRIEARDEAGNIGVFQMAQPIAVDRIRPKARIRGVLAPANNASSSAN